MRAEIGDTAGGVVAKRAERAEEALAIEGDLGRRAQVEVPIEVGGRIGIGLCTETVGRPIRIVPYSNVANVFDLAALDDLLKLSEVWRRALLCAADWDDHQSLGKLYGKTLSLPRDNDLAWDVYFVYAPGVEWTDQLPMPTEWMHQLDRDARQFSGKKLRASIVDLLPESP